MAGFTFRAGSVSHGQASALPTTMCPPANATAVDANGDLYLVVGPENRAYKVDSRALIRVSSVWKSMLTGGWVESRPADGAWIVSLPEDDSLAVGTLLHIIHHNTRSIPRASELDVYKLFELAAVVDKYDLRGCLALWPKDWLSTLLPKIQSTTEIEVLAQMGWFGWVMGSRIVFSHVLDKMMTEVESDGDGNLVDDKGEPLEKLEFIQMMDMLERLSVSRARLITDLLKVMENTVQTGAMRDSHKSPFCCLYYSAPRSVRTDIARRKVREDCNRAILGSLIQSLADESLFPLPSGPQEVFESAGVLKARLMRVARNVRTLGVPSDAMEPKCSELMKDTLHAGCNPMERLLQEMEATMAPAHCEPSPVQIRQLDRAKQEIQGGH